MEHLLNAETAWEKKTSSNLEARLKAWTSRSPTKEVCPYMPIRLVRTDTYRHSSPASAVRTAYCGSLVSGKWLAVPISIPLSTKWKRDRGNRLKAWKAEAPQEKCVRICLSDLFGQTHTDILLRPRRYGQPFVAHLWAASGWLYLSQFRFQQETKGASGKGGCAVRKIIRTSIVKPSVWCGYADFLSAMPPVPMTGPYHVRVNHQHGFTCAKKNNKKRKRQDPVKVPLSHSHERVVRLPIV